MIRFFETLGIILFLLIFVHQQVEFIEFIRIHTFQFTMILLISYCLGDLVSGIIHWVCDSLWNEDTPIIGPSIIFPFRYHHKDPLKIVRESLVENLGASSIAGVVTLIPLYFLSTSSFSLVELWIFHLYLWTSMFAVLSNLFHRWSHLPSKQRGNFIRILQKTRISISPEHHLLHHKSPFRTHYCVLSGWANQFTNYIPWTKLERYCSKIGIPIASDERVSDDIHTP